VGKVGSRFCSTISGSGRNDLLVVCQCQPASMLLLLLLAFYQRSLRARGHTAVPATPWGAYDPGTATWGIPQGAVLQKRAVHRHCCSPRADSYHPWAAKPPRLSNGLLSGSRPGWRTLLAGGLWGGAAVAGTGGPCGTVGIGVLPAAGMRGARWAGEARCCRPRAVRRAEGNLGVRAWRYAQSCVVRR